LYILKLLKDIDINKLLKGYLLKTLMKALTDKNLAVFTIFSIERFFFRSVHPV